MNGGATTEERRLVTVLFADVTGSTALGESVDPETLRNLLARYFAIGREIIESHGGTVEKFIGDALMAVFGLPLAHGDDADRALDAALELRDRVRDDPALGERLPIRLGVNSGEVVASRDAGAGDFLMTGDAVNVAARLQQAADPWAIVVGERTVSAAREAFAFRSLGGISAKGKSHPIDASELLGRATRPHVPRTPLVGRGADLAQLDLVAGRAFSEGRPFLVSVIAAPGVGKTRLLEEAIDRLRGVRPGVKVAIAQCLPYGQRLTFWPMRTLLLDLLELPADLPPDALRRGIRRWLDEAGDETAERTAELLAATIGAGEVELADRSALFAAWRSTIELAARQRPLLLVVEDLHWSSDSLLDLVEFVLQPRGEMPLLMVALARPELLDRRPTWGGGRRNFISLALEPLDDDEVGELVTYLLDGPGPGLVASIVARADGNPFYAGEIVRSIVERVPDIRDERAVLASLAALPDTVQATILARLDVLPAAERRLLQLGSVLGRTFRLTGVAALEPSLAGESDRLLGELVDRDLVRPTERDAYEFRHILIREVAYGTLTRAERIRLHESAGAWLEATAGADAEALAELIAYHFQEAIALARVIGQEVGEAARRRAVVWLDRAASAAAAGSANGEAGRHLRAAIELADADELPELYLRLGQTHLGSDAAIAAYSRAYAVGLDRGRSADFLLQALALRLTAMTRWFASVVRQPSTEEFMQLVDEAERLMEQATDDRVRAIYHVSQSFVPFWLGNLGRPSSPETLERASEHARLGFEIAERLGDAELMSAALDGLGGVAATVGDHAGALELARRRLTLEARLGLQERLDMFNVFAWQSTLVGAFDEAVTAATRGLSAVQPGQDPNFALSVANWLPYAMALQGRWEKVPAATERCRQLWIEGGRVAAGYGLTGFIAGLEVFRARGDEDGIEWCTEVVAEIVGQYHESHPTRRLAGFLGPDPEALAERVAGGWEFYGERLQHVERAFAICADRGQPIEPATVEKVIETARRRETRPLLGQALRVRGAERGSVDDLREALALFEAIGAVPYVARAEVELGRLIGEAALVERGVDRLQDLGDVGQLGRIGRSSI